MSYTEQHVDPSSGRRAAVLIVAGVRLYREGLASALAEAPGLEVIGTAADRASGAAAAAEHRPDVVVLDVAEPDGLDRIGAILTAAPDARIVALGVPDSEQAVLSCAEAGASGYVTREDSLDSLIAAVESAARGELLCSPRIAATLMRRVSTLAAGAPAAALGEARLTPREVEIVELIGQGLANKTIARRLSIELPTVKNHVHNILEKLQVSRRTDAVAYLRARRSVGSAHSAGATQVALRD